MRSDRPPPDKSRTSEDGPAPAPKGHGIGPTLSLRLRVSPHPTTCAPGGLLGPCFKTGRSGDHHAKPLNTQTGSTPAHPRRVSKRREELAPPEGAEGTKSQHTARNSPRAAHLADMAPTDCNSAPPPKQRARPPFRQRFTAGGHTYAVRRRREVHRGAGRLTQASRKERPKPLLLYPPRASQPARG